MDQLTGRLDALLTKLTETRVPGCACRVVQGDQVLYDRTFGWADIAAQRPLAPDALYRVYSMSKVVTCAALLSLYEQGLFLLSDPLAEFLPEFGAMTVTRTSPNGQVSTGPASRPIRIRDLFTMTSGLTYGTVSPEAVASTALPGETGLRSFVRALARNPLAFEPASRWQYGFSHDVLGALAEVITGKTFGEFLAETVFRPLGMADTGFRVAPNALGRLATFYREDSAGVLAPDREGEPQDMGFESGGGGLYSTMDDYTRFARCLTRGGSLDGVRILGPKTLALMTSDHLSPAQRSDFDWPYLAGYGYGLGVRVMTAPPAGGCNGSKGEFGWCGYAGTWVLMDPAEDLTVVYLHQRFPNLEAWVQPRLRAVVYGALGV